MSKHKLYCATAKVERCIETSTSEDHLSCCEKLIRCVQKLFMGDPETFYICSILSGKIRTKRYDT